MTSADRGSSEAAGNEARARAGAAAGTLARHDSKGKFGRILQELNIYIVVGPEIESCSAGKNVKEAIVVNNSD